MLGKTHSHPCECNRPKAAATAKSHSEEVPVLPLVPSGGIFCVRAVPVAWAHRPEVALSETHQQQDPISQQVQQPAAILGAVDSLDKVDEPLRRFYAQDDETGKFVARINGHFVPAETVKKFRDTNIDVMKALTVEREANAVYRRLGEDPKALEEEVLEGRKLKQRYADKELVDAKGWDAALAQRTDQMKQTYEGQINALKEQNAQFKADRDQYEAENKRIIISQGLTRAALANGALPDAISDIISRADRSGWTVNDKGEMVLFDQRTNSYVYGANGIDFITPEEWVLSLKQGSGRFLFVQPYGSGATGSDTNSSGKNPWSKDSWNETEQAKAYIADPVRAKQMAEQAGTRLGALRPA